MVYEGTPLCAVLCLPACLHVRRSLPRGRAHHRNASKVFYDPCNSNKNRHSESQELYFVAAKEGRIRTLKEAKKWLNDQQRVDPPAGRHEEVETHQASA